MSIYVIGDQDTILGMKLVGAEGLVPRGAQDARQALERALEQRDLKLLLITRDWAEPMRDRLNRLKMTRLTPVVMEIPGREVTPPEEPIAEVVRRAVGIRI